MRSFAILSAVLLSIVGCGQSNNDGPERSSRLRASGGGAENCSPVVSASVVDGIVSVSMTAGFNAWKWDNTTVTIGGTVTDTCGTNATYSEVVAGAWTQDSGSDKSCSTSWSGDEAVPAAAANHWHNLVQCDGTKVVEGCQSEKTITINTVIDGPGQNDLTSTASATVPAQQDPDVVETGCGSCDIGPCVSTCQQACADKDCRNCCECRCKDELQTAGCPAPQELCYTGSEGHAVCLTRTE